MPLEYNTRLQGASSPNQPDAPTTSLDFPITMLRIARLWSRLGEQAKADGLIADARAALKAVA